MVGLKSERAAGRAGEDYAGLVIAWTETRKSSRPRRKSYDSST